MQVLILGSTGLVGTRLLDLLLRDDKVEHINLISRRSAGIDHQKITEYITPLDKMEKFENAFQVDAVFCCLGTTLKTSGSKEEFEKIDRSFPLKAARLALSNNADEFVVISALGASSSSPFYYNQVKGLLEHDLKALGLKSLHIVRPSLIIGKRNERRPSESLAMIGFKVLKPLFLGPLKKYRGSEVQDIAKTMLCLSQNKPVETEIEFETIKNK